MKTTEKSTIETGTLYREMSFDRESANKDERTIELSFSSEEPYKRYFGNEILDHTSGSIRMDRINKGGAFLVNHNWDDQIGVVEKAFIGNDRRGRAVVRFSRSERAEEIFQDILDGIRQSISVGYIVHRMVLESTGDDGESYRVVDWEPLEISTVSVPADITVGVGRNTEEKNTTIIERKVEMENQEKPVEKASAIEVKEIQTAARKSEQERIREIMVLGEQHNMREIAQKAIESGAEVDSFRSQVLENIGKAKKVNGNAEIGMNGKEKKQYSLSRAIAAMASGNRKGAELEFDCSDEVGKKLGKQARGMFVPMDMLLASRALSVGTPADGGYLNGTTHMGQSFIDALRSRSVLQQMGAVMMEGLIGDIAIPRLDGSSTAYWVDENGDITGSTPSFGSVALSPKTVGAYIDITRKLLLQSSPSVDELLKNDMSKILAAAIDAAGIGGSSANKQPVGILNTSGIGAVVGGTTGAAPTWANIVGLEQEVAVDNADIGNLFYLTNAKVRGTLKSTFKNSTYGEIPVWGKGSLPGSGELNGYDAFVSSHVPGNLSKSTGSNLSAIIFGNFADLIIGLWGALDINVDTAALSKSGGIRLVMLQDCDVAIRHAQSFAAMKDAVTS